VVALLIRGVWIHVESLEPPIAAQYVVTFLKPEMLHLYRQIRSLSAYRPVVFCQRRENGDQFPFEPVHVLGKARTHQIRRLWQKMILRRPITIYPWEGRRALKAIEAEGSRVMHVYFGHIGVHLEPLLRLCAQERSPGRVRLPVVVSFHGADAQVDMDKPGHWAAMQRMFALVQGLLVRSESLAKRLVECGAPREKIRLHRTGLPLDELAYVQRRVPESGAWRCLQACRLIQKKGLFTSLAAFAEFRRRWPKAGFTIAGEGPLLVALREEAKKLGIAEAVRFVGFVSQDKLRLLEAESHFFLHPSEVGPDGDQEGVPNAMIEAMAHGLPALATRHGGIPEAVEDGVSGLLVDEGDVRSLAARMLELADSPERYSAMSASAAERVRKEFDLATQGRRLEAIYDEVLSGQVGKAG
jgi:colanic acid/amylovoran biosynthesis glycosyltransferase